MELQFTTLNKITLTEQVMQQLASKIISGELKPGEKLAARTRPCRNASGVPQQGTGSRCALFPLSGLFPSGQAGGHMSAITSTRCRKRL